MAAYLILRFEGKTLDQVGHIRYTRIRSVTCVEWQKCVYIVFILSNNETVLFYCFILVSYVGSYNVGYKFERGHPVLYIKFV